MSRPSALKPLEPEFWDIFALVVGAVLMLLNTILYAYAMAHHRYPPLRAKNLRLISVLWVCTLVWYLGIIGTNFNIGHLFGESSSSCTAFGLWLRVLLGVFTFIYIHIMRLYLYIRIFLQVRRVTYRIYLVGCVIYFAMILGFGIPMTILHDSLTVTYVKVAHTCVYGRLFIELSFSLVWAGWAAAIVVAFMARKINSSFREYHEMLLIIGLCTVTVLYETISQHINQEYTFHRWSRVVSTFAEYLACQSSLAILLGIPVYNCIYHREEYKEEFFRKMVADGLSSRYKLTLPTSRSHTTFDAGTAVADATDAVHTVDISMVRRSTA